MAVYGINNSASTATRFLNVANSGLNRSIARLSSGNKFAIPGDTKGQGSVSHLENNIRSLGTVLEGLQALSDFQTAADSYMSSVQDTLTTARELADRAQSAAYTNSDRAAFDADFQALMTQTRTMITNARYGGLSVVQMTTSLSNALGNNVTSYSIDTADALTDITGITLAINVSTAATAQAARTAIDNAQSLFDIDRAGVLTDISNLARISNSVAVEKSNKETLLSMFKDVDFPTESTNLAKQNILVQSATAMLAQANSLQQNVLTLLK